MKYQQKAKGIGTLALLLCQQMQTVTGYQSNDVNKRWTDGPQYIEGTNNDNSGYAYDTTEAYTDVDGLTETYRMQWELYEGSISLVQMALVWKEISEENQH